MGLPNELLPLLMRGNQSYLINQSLRFNSADSAFLSRTPSVAGNRRTWTWAGWVKRAVVGTYQTIFGGWLASNDTGYTQIFFLNDKLNVSGWTTNWRITTQLFRDTSSWYHILVAFDTTQTIPESRCRIYVNGLEVTQFDTNNALTINTDYGINTAAAHNIGREVSGGGQHFNGYLAEINFIDGQALTPSSFGQFDSTTGVWVPRRYTGTYGTNGFYLNFADNSAATATALGKDSSGNNNNWTPNNHSVAAGIGNDVLLDSPTNNFCTLNALTNTNSTTLFNGGLDAATSSASGNVVRSTFFPSSGKWYFECTMNFSATGFAAVGVVESSQSIVSPTSIATVPSRMWLWRNDAIRINNGSGTSYGTSASTGEVIQVAYDVDAGKIWFGRQNTWFASGNPEIGLNESFSGLTGMLSPVVNFQGTTGSSNVVFNFGQRAFAYAPPAGFQSLCTNNLSNPSIMKPSDHFDVRTYIGNGGSLQVGNVVKEASTYTIANSLRFNSPDSPNLTRTFGTPTNNLRWSLSWWQKRSEVTVAHGVFSALSGSSNFSLQYSAQGASGAGDRLNLLSPLTATYTFSTAAEYRDPSIWQHNLFVYDSANATQADRAIFYVDNVRQTAAIASVALNQACNWNQSGATGEIGRTRAGYGTKSDFFDGYMAEIYFIDGQALTPSSFGESDANGVWIPKAYTGTYGANGFYLNFSNTSGVTSTTLGKDNSGNNNDWTPNNFSVTAGLGNDALLDSPTNNYPVLDQLTKGASVTISDGGLQAITSATVAQSAFGTFPIRSGKWYWEGIGIAPPNVYFGISAEGHEASTYIGASSAFRGYAYNDSGNIVGPFSGTLTTYGTSYTASDVIGIAYDADNGNIWFSKNGTWQNSGNPATGTNPAFSNIPAGVYRPGVAGNGVAGKGFIVNFGQRPFAYTPPAGFLALNTDNMAVMGEVAGSPDLVWIKSRSAATDWAVYDTTRGATLDLATNLTAAETTQVNGLQRFDRNGFYIGNLAKINTLNATYVSYLWNEGITPGLDIVTFAGNGAVQNVNHNLGVVPSMMILKDKTGAGRAWTVYHRSIANSQNGGIYLNTTGAWNTDNTLFNSTAPTSTQFTAGTYYSVNGETLIAYLFAEIPGFSRFGSYVGNGAADGPFVWCGFRPRWVLIKNVTTASTNWRILDSEREPRNPLILEQATNGPTTDNFSDAADTDFLAGGFKIRTISTDQNTNGVSYIFAAFAEAPFKFARAR